MIADVLRSLVAGGWIYDDDPEIGNEDNITALLRAAWSGEERR